MDFIQRTRRFSPALATHLEQVGNQSLDFSGSHPLDHSRHNHVHLWKLELEADLHPEINLQYRVDAVQYILQSWTRQLKFHPRGPHLFYLYEDFAPTVSMVRETDHGFPYGGTPVFVDHPEKVMKLYAGRSWQAQFRKDHTADQVLDLLQKHEGSLTRTARSLGWSLADLRKSLERWDLATEVNAIRKHHHRRPAQLLRSEELPHTYRIYQFRVEH